MVGKKKEKIQASCPSDNNGLFLSSFLPYFLLLAITAGRYVGVNERLLGDLYARYTQLRLVLLCVCSTDTIGKPAAC